MKRQKLEYTETVVRFFRGESKFHETKIFQQFQLLYRASKLMDVKSQEWLEATEARIREAFDLFDKDKR